MPVDISRTGYTGDLGYEIWMPWDRAVEVWDALMPAAARSTSTPAGMLALDVARVEAGLLLIDVDFHSSKKALIESQKYSPFEMGLGRLVQLDKRGRSSAARARSPSSAAGRRGRSSASRSSWPAVEALYDSVGLRAADRRRRVARRRAGLQRAAARSAARRRPRGRRC